MPEQEYEVKKLTSLADLTIDGEVRDVGDLTEDAWEFGAPPPRDIYMVKFFLAKDAWEMRLKDPKDPASIYLQGNLECRTKHDNPDYDNIPVFFRVNTRLYRGHSISTMEGLIAKFGYGESLKKKGKLTDKMIAQFLELAIKKEPILPCELDWRGSYSYVPKGSKDGTEVWENIYSNYEDFPPDPDNKGGRLHMVKLTGRDGLPKEVRAQLYISKIYGKGEEAPKPGTLGLVSAPKTVSPQIKVAVEEPTIKLATPEAPKARATAPTVQSDEADMELLLAE